MNPNLFKKRLIAFYSCWRKQKRDLWGNADVLVIGTDSPGNPTRPISSLFFSWLTGHDFPDTVAVFTRNEIYFICSRKKLLGMVRTLESPAMEAVNARVVVHVKGKDENGLEFLDGVIRGMKVAYDAKAGCNDARPLVIGYISGESPKSKLLWSCFNNLKPMEFRSAHVLGFSRLLNHDQDVRYSGDSATDRKDLELFEESISSYEVSGSHHQNCPQIQMQSLPDKFEQMLALAPERREGAPPDANGKKLQLEMGDRNPPGRVQDKGEKTWHSEEVEGSCREDGSDSDVEEEWVLVEDDKEEYMGERDKVNVFKKSMALANYRL